MRWALIALAACSGGSGPVVVANAGEVPHRASPAPQIEWRDNAFQTPALPAVARAGEVVVVALRENDAGRGFPNLTLEVRDRADKTIQTIDVMTSNEYETLAPGGTPNAELARRITAANAALVHLHDLHDLVTMHPLETQQADDPHLAIGDGLDIDFNIDHVHVFRHNSDRPVFVRDARAWLIKEHEPCKGCGMCQNPAFLRSVFHVPMLDLVVVQLSYRGTDTCWEPSDQLHVVAW
ncbi:MAG: hypothetical protein ABI678_32990 [Kofleriaceae bacterium]